MKNTLSLMFSIILLTGIYTAGMAQDQNTEQNQIDENITQNAEKDLMTKYPDMDHQTIEWERLSNSYYANYRRGDKNYRTRYDADGKWVETMEEKNWNEEAPDNFRAGLMDNAYEHYEVDSYWEITESNRDKGYLLNLRDKDGNTQEVRMDSQGTIIDEEDYNDPR